MSKIQDAIRRLQSSQEVASLSRGEAETQRLARLTRPDTSSDATIDLDKERVITLDLDLLRQTGFLAPTEQRRFIADQYRVIKRPLLDNASGRGAHQSEDANLVMVGSPLPGDGKTFNCINLALSIATEKDKSVLLVDADVAKPHISMLFGLENEPGLIDLLTNSNLEVGDVLLQTNIPGLIVLPAGKQDEHATELLASRRMARLVHVLSTSLPDRITVFDSPPLLVTSEARVLASVMGQIVLVVCAGRTPQNAVLEAAASLDPDKPISVVLNRAGRGLGGDGYGYANYGTYGSAVRSERQESKGE
ncbi:XrtA-associated tyrosine autokinase [Lentisalinibacter sediminis]|uniref:XrtA-associated tyrosine autokinase n=1 Tax=Lentisalinibacter sediminis TaxID=2992237 RepID=UPI00386FCFC1